jgi:hypothetical protein
MEGKMLMDVILNNDSITVSIDNPFHVDLDLVMGEIEKFTSSKNVALSGVDVRELIPKMIRGIAGCESGCPANAKNLVEQGFRNFELKYIEGGILSAKATISDGTTLHLKMFPEF